MSDTEAQVNELLVQKPLHYRITKRMSHFILVTVRFMCFTLILNPEERL